MTKSIKIVLVMAAMVAAFASVSFTQAATCTPGGSPTNHAGSCETSTGDLKCGGTATPAGPTVAAGAGGVEVCTEDGGAIPVEGRIGGDAECQCIYADGGDSNQSPANGWARLDPDNGLTCSAGNPSYNQGGGSMGDCG